MSEAEGKTTEITVNIDVKVHEIINVKEFGEFVIKGRKYLPKVVLFRVDEGFVCDMTLSMTDSFDGMFVKLNNNDTLVSAMPNKEITISLSEVKLIKEQKES